MGHQVTAVMDRTQLADPDVELGEPIHTHIIVVGPGQDAGALVTEARVMGSQVEALCGYRWTPARDPAKHPLCSKCEAIYNQIGHTL